MTTKTIDKTLLDSLIAFKPSVDKMIQGRPTLFEYYILNWK